VSVIGNFAKSCTISFDFTNRGAIFPNSSAETALVRKSSPCKPDYFLSYRLLALLRPRAMSALWSLSGGYDLAKFPMTRAKNSDGPGSLTVLSEDGERVLCRGWRDDGDSDRIAVLAVLSASEHPTPSFADRPAHEYGLKDELDGLSAARPLALVREHGRTVLLPEDPGGEPLAASTSARTAAVCQC
jgi:hypothetical protein